MMRSSFALLAMAVSAVSAQTTVQNYKSSLDMTIDPNTVDLATRSSWCGAQQNTCDALCKDNTNENQCTENDLKWECTCSSNSSTPGLQYYTQTMPTFICEELFSQCISQNTGSQSGQRDCTSKIEDKCAKQSPPKDVVSDDDGDTSSTATDTATTSATRTSSEATGTAESVTSTRSDAFAAPTMAPAGRGAAAAVALGMLAYMI